MRRTCIVLIALLSLVAVPFVAVAQSGSPAASQAAGGETVRIFGAITSEIELTVADLQALPVETIDVTYTAGGEAQDHTFVGTSLIGAFETWGLDVPEDAKNPLLTTYLVFTAKDGYQVIVSGGEIDPGFGNVPMYLAWEQDGAALAGDDGPLRLVVPGDTRGGRYIEGIVSIEIVRLETGDHQH